MKNCVKAITSTLDQHAPETTKKRTKRLTKSLYDKDAQKLKRQRRVAGKSWLRKKGTWIENAICI